MRTPSRFAAAVRPVSWIGAGVLLLTLTSAAAAATLAPTPWKTPRLASDRATYAPDALARLSGSGFIPGGIVTLRVTGAASQPGSEIASWTVTADAAGRFQTSWRVCRDDCVHDRLTVAASAVDGTSAQTTFVDDPDAPIHTTSVASGCPLHVLILSDEDNPGTAALTDALTSAGHFVTVRPAPECTWDGTDPPLAGFDVVVHLDGQTYACPLPVSSQTLLETFVSSGGTFVASQWDGYEEEIAQQIDMPDLVLLRWGVVGSADNCGGCSMTWTVVPGQEGNPILAGLPSSFTFWADGHDASPAIVFGVNPSTVIMTAPSGGPAVLVRDFGTGHVVNFSSAANYQGIQTLQDPNILRLYTNAVSVGGCPNSPPDVSGAVASTPVLWPPNHKYQSESILGVTDPDGDPVTIEVTGVSQDEPVNGAGDGNTCPDAQLVEGQVSVRAERSGTAGTPGNGRVYRIAFSASDGKGGVSTGFASVCVPHDNSLASCVDDGQKYNSLGSCRTDDGAEPEVVASNASLALGAVTHSAVAIEFSLPRESDVDLSVFDLAGRRITRLEAGHFTSGSHARVWNTTGVPSGAYFVRLRSAGGTVTKTVITRR